jgi:hypothetical protein
VAEDHAADGSGHEAHGEGGVRREGAGERVELREEELVEDEAGRRAVDEEVVPLDVAPMDEAKAIRWMDIGPPCASPPIAPTPRSAPSPSRVTPPPLVANVAPPYGTRFPISVG